MHNPLAKKILFLKVKNQDPEAYGQFYDVYVAKIYRFIFFKVNSAPDAQDLTSEVFLKLWQCIKEGKEIRNLNAFIYMIARNSVIDFYRQRTKDRESVSLNDNDAGDIKDEKKDLWQEKMLSSDMESILKGLERLKDEYKEVIILRFLDDLSISEMGQILNRSNGSIRVLLHRATKALKENLNERIS